MKFKLLKSTQNLTFHRF